MSCIFFYKSTSLDINMDIQIEYVLVVIILLIMAWLMRIRKLDLLISRYEGFQKILRSKPFTVNEKGVANFYSYLFLFSGITVSFNLFVNTSELVSSVIIGFFVIIFVSVLYLNITKRFLVFEE